mmetsp:Transcript_20052/g.63926  ORF Transcript_20052/g.63926 Transcript_20052/m.63926 type:complete len:223 (+) Transcript_20052:400-1068(+)
MQTNWFARDRVGLAWQARAECSIRPMAAVRATTMARMGDLTRHVQREHCVVGADGIELDIPRSETDQGSRGRHVSVPRRLRGQDGGQVDGRLRHGAAARGCGHHRGRPVVPPPGQAASGEAWATQLQRGKPWDTRAVTRYIHRLLESAGVPAGSRQTGHGARRGGAQALLRRGVAEEDIAVAGGWAVGSRALHTTYLGTVDTPRPRTEEVNERVRRAWNTVE